MARERTIVLGLLGVLALSGASGCSTWTTSSVDTGAVATPAEATQPKRPEQIHITEGDYPNLKYTALGDITVTVNKTTLFHPDPTRYMVDRKLREEAAKLGADAVIFVRYGSVGVSLMSYGSLEGKGRAIKFAK